jgi:hypothetical protein
MLAIYAAGIVFTAALAIPNGSIARDPTGVLYQLDFTAFMVVGALIVARRHRGRLVLGLGGVPRVWPDVHLHPAAVSHRAAAVAPLATSRLAGRPRPGRGYRAGRPPADPDRRVWQAGDRQPDRDQWAGPP